MEHMKKDSLSLEGNTVFFFQIDMQYNEKYRTGQTLNDN